MSLLAGPSAALLAVPNQRTDWPAGSSSFWLIGNEELSWPSNLTASDTGGSHSANPSIQLPQTEALNSSGCIWAGFLLLAEVLKQSQLDTAFDVVLNDGVSRRESPIRPGGEVAETWILSSDPKEVATALVSGPHTKICIRILPRTVNRSFFGLNGLLLLLKPII